MERKSAWVNLESQDILTAFSNHMLIGGSLKRPKRIWVGWKKPPKGWVKVNTDGCVHGGTGMAKAGGIIINEEGVWLGGFSINLGCCSVEGAELRAVLHGLKMAWDSGSNRLILESDCLTVVKWLKGMGETSFLFESLIQECREWLRRRWVVNVCHTYREDSRMADYMDKRARNVHQRVL